MDEFEDMERRLTMARPSELRACEPNTPCAVMDNQTLRRGLVRMQIGKRFLVRLLDRAMEISVTRVFTLPPEFRDIPSPSYWCVFDRHE